MKDEEGIKKADEEGQKGEIEGQEEEISTSQATDESDQVLTTIAVDTESTGESDTQATETEALSGLDLGITTEALTDIASTDDYSE
ncbi:hypothetical protein FTX61_26995, partial [Nitriliruptoraceae bacterium ZYF776]|nr:hypothetical protein [Profundirhabdus halotolerans]